MHWILMSERSDEYELSIDELPPMLDSLDVSFDEGRFIAISLPKVEVPISPHAEEYITDNIVAPTRLGLLINKKIRAIFDSLDIDNIQYFPASIRNINTNKAIEDYWIANVVGKIACVDHEKSELTYFDDDEIEFIDKLVLKLDESRDYGHIFRLAEFPPVLVISDDLKSLLEKSEVTGLCIYKPEEFSL